MELRKHHIKHTSKPVKEKKQVGEWQCPICGDMVKAKHGPNADNTKVDPLCKICNKAFTRKEIFFHHMMSNHPSSTQLHELYHLDPGLHTVRMKHMCCICNKSFGSSNNLLYHQQEIHKEIPDIPCPEPGCKFMFKSNRNLTRHKKKDHGCESETILQASVIPDGESVKFECIRCGKCLPDANALRCHQERHGDKNLLCNICGKTFASKYDLQRHGKRHIERPKLHKCQFCYKLFSTQSECRTHELFHKDKTFLCQDCGKKFYTKGLLIRHSVVHTKLTPFKCRHCSKEFSFAAARKQHELTHADYRDRPFQCTYEGCNAAYAEKAHLVQHVAKHTGIKPYTCQFCNKGYGQKGYLNIHIKRQHKYPVVTGLSDDIQSAV